MYRCIDVIMRRIEIFNLFLIIFASYFVSTNASVQLPTTGAGTESLGLDLPGLVPVNTPLLNNGNDCSITCPNIEGSEPSILKYVENDTHRYKIESLVAIHTPNSVRGEGTKLIYQAFFDLSAESKCSFVLKLSNVNIIGPNGKKHVDTTFTAQPYAKFTWMNGKLDKLCLDNRDTEAGANFKRSIIANLQIPSWSNPIARSMSTDGFTTYETDHQGRCPVTISTSQSQDGSWIVKKNKDLSQCTHRQGFDFSFATNSYHSDDSRQTNPFVEAHSQSMIKIEKNIVRMAEIREKYDFRPIGNYGESLTSALITTKINWVEKKTKNPIPLVSFQPSSASLLYQTPTSTGGETTVPTIIKAIQDASQDDDDGVVSVNGTKRFGDLVYVLQRAKKSDLLTTYVQVKSGAGFTNTDAAKAVFWDGLIATATATTTEVGVTLIMNSQMPTEKIDDFLKSFNFVSYPTEQTLTEVSKLLDDSNAPFTRYLAVGSIIRRYAAYHSTDSPVVKNLQSKLSTPILNGCIANNVEEEDRIIASLKGLSNCRYLTPDVTQMVVNCVKNTNVGNRIRTNVLQTMLINANDDRIKKTALELFKTRDEDVEIRLAAFLVFVNSPSNEAAEILKNILDNEQSDQVGGYVTSFLANLRTTNDPQLQTLRHYFGQIKPKRKFPHDFRQYSRNYQFSQLFATLNSGYSADGDIIFSQQSYVPRSTNFGLNANLFGNSFNLFKMSARFENVDYLIEKAVGPRSYLRSTPAEQVADDLVDMARELAGDVAERASVLGQTKYVAQEITNNLPNIKRNPTITKKSTSMDFSVKMFDSEIIWSTYHQDQNTKTNKEFMDTLYDGIEDAVKNTRNVDIDYKKSYRSPILSRSIIYYATSSGLPLKLSANADAVAHFKMNATVDAIKLLREPQTADVRMLIKPRFC